MTFAQALQAVHDAGFHVHNLFERDVARGLWQANLFKPGERTYSQFGIAETPEGALLDALAGVATPGPATETRVAPTAAPARIGSLFD